jgi:hypothetical protein
MNAGAFKSATVPSDRTMLGLLLQDGQAEWITQCGRTISQMVCSLALPEQRMPFVVVLPDEAMK